MPDRRGCDHSRKEAARRKPTIDTENLPLAQAGESETVRRSEVADWDA